MKNVNVARRREEKKTCIRLSKRVWLLNGDETSDRHIDDDNDNNDGDAMEFYLWH